MISILCRFIKAERTADAACNHLSLREMLPYLLHLVITII